ncbi:hypothetical protein M406DRAFT_335911 [Cryphonectria parasitica EP155]|uniref:Zn(2)-C6 fungal-type domain-containing protein n=1 Tax=Cryphonectria parasitica (strain ATCC 38755 / EP155) TaxID=660469 RepID=A0A9P5CUN3_CRYP1|nr:uncharacterized protein M406DRAFT_335911 [Cryphonectria parasitica EP155]KAF3770195.1 hypothetical protein M406DRAFT_335911 [Cryphonectria parasitica EP155]
MDLYGTATPPRPAGSISSSDSPLESHSAPANAAPSVPAACLGCRAKHLKCDGNTPCARCVSSAIECVYVASRRGYKGPRRAMAPNPNKRHASSSPDARGGGDIVPSGAQGPGPDNCPMLLGAGIAPGLTSTAFTGGTTTNGSSPAGAAAPFLSAASSMNHLQLYRNPPFSTPLDAIQHGAPPMAPIISIEDKCFDSFYYHYHAAHPFVLPKEHLSRHVRETGQKLEHLMTAMRYVGSLFLQAGPARASYLDEALRLCQSPATARDGFLVQALLLLIVALDGSCQQDKARDLLGEAERIAIEIGLNTREYATLHGRGLPILEESWRRTWWDLYVCDGMVAGVHRVTNFYLYDATAIGTLPGLPCEESEYLSGNIPHPMYLEDFEDQVFSGEDRTFSSFAYRIAAIRNLGRFMRCPPIMFPEDENLVKMDTHLTNWRLHLPPGKRDPIDKSCAPDEMLFQAHFITTACTIMLHQPHSQLDASPARSVNSCAPYRAVPTGDAFNSHTRHTITAACDIARMITYAVPLQHHTHFFTCVITMASIVHLSKWALYFIPDEDDLREQIRLSIGALSKLSVIWKAAATACGQVKGVAQEIYRAKKAAQLTPAFWIGFTQAEMINSLNVDDNVMSEIDSMLSSVTSAPQ